MRGLPLILLSVSFAGAIAVACGSFDGDPPLVDDAGGGDSATTNESGSTEEAGLDGGLVTDADAGDAFPSDMVPVVVGTKTFLIDKTEVTYKAYGNYVDSVLNADGDGGFQSIPGCLWHPASPAVVAGGGCALETQETAPITCVDWCDAVVYCKAKGKRLCGAINGGATPYANNVDPAVSQWTRACANDTNSANRYPYGTTLIADACNSNGNPTAGTGTHVLPVGTFPKCQGGVPGLYDMDGNAAEWTDSCSGTENGANDNCITQGGSWGQVQPFCSVASGIARGSTSGNVGFRCCKDLP